METTVSNLLILIFNIVIIGLPALLLVSPFLLLIHFARKPAVPQSKTVRWRKREIKVRDDYEVRDVGWLLDELHYGNRHTRPLTFAALTNVLPEMRSYDAHRLTSHHHTILHTLLDSFVSLGRGSAQEVVLCLGILKALENVGEAGDEWHVQNLALSARLPSIREAALATLPVLQARIVYSNSMNSLLRASQQPAVNAENLLRPVQERGDAHPESLLRPR